MHIKKLGAREKCRKFPEMAILLDLKGRKGQDRQAGGGKSKKIVDFHQNSLYICDLI
jgi:hypothetical protein